MEIGMKGQGATEYLVLLAVVLIIALVSIALLGFFPGLVPDARITQSSSYWQTQKPFAIKEAVIKSDGTGTLILMNNDASGSVSFAANSIKFGSVTLTHALKSIGPGETTTLTFSGATFSGSNCASGSIVDTDVTFTYTSAGGITGAVQKSSKNLVVKCT